MSEQLVETAPEKPKSAKKEKAIEAPTPEQELAAAAADVEHDRLRALEEAIEMALQEGGMARPHAQTLPHTVTENEARLADGTVIPARLVVWTGACAHTGLPSNFPPPATDSGAWPSTRTCVSTECRGCTPLATPPPRSPSPAGS